jgi:hypothetical protein
MARHWSVEREGEVLHVIVRQIAGRSQASQRQFASHPAVDSHTTFRERKHLHYPRAGKSACPVQ